MKSAQFQSYSDYMKAWTSEYARLGEVESIAYRAKGKAEQAVEKLVRSLTKEPTQDTLAALQVASADLFEFASAHERARKASLAHADTLEITAKAEDDIICPF